MSQSSESTLNSDMIPAPETAIHGTSLLSDTEAPPALVSDHVEVVQATSVIELSDGVSMNALIVNNLEHPLSISDSVSASPVADLSSVISAESVGPAIVGDLVEAQDEFDWKPKGPRDPPTAMPVKPTGKPVKPIMTKPVKPAESSGSTA